MARKKKGTQGAPEKLLVEHHGMYPYLQRYLEYMQINNYSLTTHNRHDSNIRQFMVWCDERGLNDVTNITKPILERYKKHLYYRRKSNGEPLSFRSQSVKLSSLKGWFKWLTQDNYLLYNPASELSLPRAPQRIPRKILSLEEVRDLMNSADLSTPKGLRDRAVMELLYSCGLRRNECASLRLVDFDPKRATVFVNEGKGKKDRLLPVGESACLWIKKYLDTARHQLLTNANDALFITNYGEAYNADCLGRIVKSHMKKAGIEAEGAAHLLRHAMATHMLENGADIRFIQTMLGHADLRATQIYTQVTVEKLREIHRATHPSKIITSE